MSARIARRWCLTRLLHERDHAHAVSALAAEPSAAKVSARCVPTLLKVGPSTRRKVSPEQAPLLRGASKPEGRTWHGTHAMFGLASSEADGCRA